jgi:RuvB-like protein 2
VVLVTLTQSVGSFAFLNRALESELAPVLVLATNRGAAPIRGTSHVGAHGMPADLLDRLLIVATEPYTGAEMRQILEIRAREEDVVLSKDALDLLAKTAADTSLRYAMRLISAAALVAARRKAVAVELDDVRRVYNLFFDTGRSSGTPKLTLFVRVTESIRRVPDRNGRQNDLRRTANRCLWRYGHR